MPYLILYCKNKQSCQEFLFVAQWQKKQQAKLLTSKTERKVVSHIFYNHDIQYWHEICQDFAVLPIILPSSRFKNYVCVFSFVCDVYQSNLGQTTQASSYYCYENNAMATFSLSSSTHSAWQPILNCTLQKCNLTLNSNNQCRPSSTPCFNYRTINNASFCAPGIDCSILESCNNVNYSCSSNSSTCIINSCCPSQAVCLPSSLKYYCKSGKNTQPDLAMMSI